MCMGNNKNFVISRHLDRNINTAYPKLPENSKNCQQVNAIVDFSNYCQMFHDSMCYIKNNLQQNFDSTSDTSIAEYLQLLDNYYTQFESYVYRSKIIENLMASSTKKEWENYTRFARLPNQENLANGISTIVDENIILIDSVYETLKSITNKVFLMEAIVSNTLKKSMQNEEIAIDKTGKKRFRFFARVIVPMDWRQERKTQEISSFFANRVAMSTSLVSDMFSVLFTCGTYYQTCPIYGYLYSPNAHIIACNKYDAMLEEAVNNKTPLKKSAILHSGIDNIAIIKKGKDSHELYANALYYLWPEYTYNKGTYCNEYILSTDEKPIAIFYSNNGGKKAATKLKYKNNLNLPIVELPIVEKAEVDSLIQ